MNKHYSRKELLAKLWIGDSDPKLGFPPKPRNLPRKTSKAWVETAERLHQYEVLWTWEEDAAAILAYVTCGNLAKREEIIRAQFGDRIPGEDPSVQLAKRRDAATYWQHFTVDDLNRLRLTPAEAQALEDWQKQPHAENPADTENIDVPPATDNGWTNRKPGVPPLPAGLTPVQAAFWKIAAISVLFGMNDEIAEACRASGGVDFFVDRMVESLPRLQKGLAPLV